MFKEIVDGRTDARTDDGRRTLKDHKSSLSTSCSGELINYKNGMVKLGMNDNLQVFSYQIMLSLKYFLRQTTKSLLKDRQ